MIKRIVSSILLGKFTADVMQDIIGRQFSATWHVCERTQPRFCCPSYRGQRKGPDASVCENPVSANHGNTKLAA